MMSQEAVLAKLMMLELFYGTVQTKHIKMST